MSFQAVNVKNGEAQGDSCPSFQVPQPVNALADYPRRLRQFLHEVRVEMKQVTWPTWNDVRATTAVVIVAVIFFAAFFFLVDSGVGYAVQRVFTLFKH
jgi:preprotein translocase subunit SecE